MSGLGGLDNESANEYARSVGLLLQLQVGLDLASRGSGVVDPTMVEKFSGFGQICRDSNK
jgi:hypothetical protein